MKVLFDEDVPHKLRLNVAGHDVSTTAYMGWSGLKNGELLRMAEASAFEVFVTCDKRLTRQQNVNKRPFGIVVLSSQYWPILRLHLEEITKAVDAARPGSIRMVECV